MEERRNTGKFRLNLGRVLYNRGGNSEKGLGIGLQMSPVLAEIMIKRWEEEKNRRRREN